MNELLGVWCQKCGVEERVGGHDCVELNLCSHCKRRFAHTVVYPGMCSMECYEEALVRHVAGVDSTPITRASDACEAHNVTMSGWLRISEMDVRSLLRKIEEQAELIDTACSECAHGEPRQRDPVFGHWYHDVTGVYGVKACPCTLGKCS